MNVGVARRTIRKISKQVQKHKYKYKYKDDYGSGLKTKQIGKVGKYRQGQPGKFGKIGGEIYEKNTQVNQ